MVIPTIIRGPRLLSNTRPVSVARKVAERSEYGQVVPSHPPLGDFSAADAEYGSEIKLHFATRRWKWTHWTVLRTLIHSPCSDKISFGDQNLGRLDRIGKNRRILLQKFLNLIKIPNLDC